MNVLYYIPSLNQKTGGTRQYSIALLETLASEQTGNQYYILHNLNDKLVIDIVGSHPNVHLIPARIGTEKKSQKLWRLLIKEMNYILENRLHYSFRFSQYSYLNAICRKYKIHIVHSPIQYTPEVKVAKKICTMHDVQELHFPEYFTPQQRSLRAIGYLDAISRADKIVVSYEHVKKDLIKYFQVPPNKILVCLLEMKNLWVKKHTTYSPDSIAALNLPNKFLLYPANTWEHKNHLGLIEAVAYLRDKQHIHLNIVCTGAKYPFFFDTIHPRLTTLNLNDQFSFLDIVDEETLYALYHTCTGVVIPTTYEAGSFPLMESIIMQVPVICSNVTSLPETIENPKFVFDPFNTEDIAEKCTKIYNDPIYREENIANNKRLTEGLLYNDASAKLLNMYKTL